MLKWQPLTQFMQIICIWNEIFNFIIDISSQIDNKQREKSEHFYFLVRRTQIHKDTHFVFVFANL